MSIEGKYFALSSSFIDTDKVNLSIGYFLKFIYRENVWYAPPMYWIEVETGDCDGEVMLVVNRVRHDEREQLDWVSRVVRLLGR